jgi:hypothetical protein
LPDLLVYDSGFRVQGSQFGVITASTLNREPLLAKIHYSIFLVQYSTVKKLLHAA